LKGINTMLSTSSMHVVPRTHTKLGERAFSVSRLMARNDFQPISTTLMTQNYTNSC